MRTLLSCLAAALMAAIVTFSAAVAGENDPLFVNLTAEDPHRVNMALSFSSNQLDRKHPVAIFLNDRAVLVGSKAQADKFGAHQKKLQDMMAKGAVVLICPMCMKHYGVTEADLIPGLKIGSPELTGELLFRDGGKTLTW